MSVGNTFTVSGAVHANGRLFTLDDRVVTRDAVDAAEPPLPTPWPRAARRIYEVPVGADAATIQRTIDAAVREGSARPVVHVPAGEFPVDRTLVIPPSDVQLVGDGKMTKLDWRGTSEGPLLLLQAPSRATLREFRVRGVRRGEGIVVPGLDRAGSRVHLEGVQLNGGGDVNLRLDRTGAARVQLVDIGHGNSGGVSFDAEGPARAVIESGASSNSKLSYRVRAGASVLARDIWYEGSADNGFAQVSDGGRFALQGTRVSSPKGWTPPAFAIDASAGRFVLATTQLDDRVVVVGTKGTADILEVASLRGDGAMPGFTNSSTAPAVAALLQMRHRVSSGGLVPRNSVPTPNLDAPDAAFLRAMLSEIRHVPWPSLGAVPAGESDVRLFRVTAEGNRVNLRLSGQP